jgi:hypothetical protein
MNKPTRRSWLAYVSLRNYQQLLLPSCSVLPSYVQKSQQQHKITLKKELSACLILRILDTDGFREFAFRSFGIGVGENILIEEEGIPLLLESANPGRIPPKMISCRNYKVICRNSQQ